MEDDNIQLIREFFDKHESFIVAVRNGTATKEQQDLWAKENVDLMERMGLIPRKERSNK
jgi:hypothetical protein